MTAVDYLLFDNRTSGSDWDIKAATGPLAKGADLQSEFIRYCHSIPSEFGRLGEFEDAVGGFGFQKGYLLCVTLFNRDAASRPSRTIVGLWCRDAYTLETVLDGDPIGSARAVFESVLPSRIGLRPGSTAIQPRPPRHSMTTAFHPYDQTSAREAMELLLGAVRSRTARLPNILGITAASRLDEYKGSFDVVYVHPTDDSTKLALARHASPPEPSSAEWVEPAPVATVSFFVSSEGSRLEPAGLNLTVWLLFALVAIAGIAVFLKVDNGRFERALDPATTTSTTFSSSSSSVSTEAGARATPPRPQKLLNEIGQSIEDFKQLDPSALRRTASYQAAHALEVVDSRRIDRERVRRAFEELLEIHARVIDRPDRYVRYYIEEEKTRTPEEQLQSITEVLSERPLGRQACADIEYAFAFEFETDSVVRRWCASSAKLERVASSIRNR